MKLVMFSKGSEDARIGLVVGDRLIDVPRHLADAPRDMSGLMKQWPVFKSRFESLARKS